MPELAFKRLGKYEIQAQLGRGGFGVVLRAFDPTVGRLVAIKVLVSEAGKDLVTRFRNEATAAGNLRHENIVTIYEFGEDKGMPFIAMEYLEGEDLQQAMASGKPLTLLDKVSIMTQAAAGLDCAHRHGVVHRDVKPSNIRLLPDGTVKIMDFGIARLLRESGVERLTRRGHVIGTLHYMAPEQVMGSETDALCDIFAYGVTCYELITGRHPFQADDPRSVFYKITSEDPELIHHLVPNCPETLDHVIRRALHKDRELRYQTLRDLRVDVEPVLMALRKERAAALVADAQGMVGDRNFEHALSLLNEAIDLDSANHPVRQLRDSVQVELRRRLVRPRIEALLAKADQFVADGNHNDAVHTLETALRLDPEDATLQSRSREAQQRRDQVRESGRLIVDARAELAKGTLTAALQKASEAIALNPKSLEARSLLEIVQAEVDRRERQHRLNEKLRQAREFLLLNSFDEALAVMKTLEPEEGRAPETVDLLARLEAQQAECERQERLVAELAAARELLDHRQFNDAVRLLQGLTLEFPGEPRVGGLLSYAQQELAAQERTQAIQHLQGEVLTCAEAKRFEEAIELLGAALSKFPGESGILRLRDTVLLARSAWERRQAVESTVRRCEALAEQLQFDEALAAINETRRKYPDDAALDGLRRRLDIDKERHRKERAVLTTLELSERLMSEGRPETAAAQLEAALAESSDERLLLAFEQAREAQTANEAIAAAEETAHALRREGSLQEAIAVVVTCRERFPNSDLLVRLDADLREEFAVRAAVEEAHTLMGRGDLERAVELLRGASTRYPGAGEIGAELVRAEVALLTRQREQALHRAEVEARELARACEFERALQVLDAAGASWPGQPEVESLRAELTALQAASIREREVAAAEQQALALCSEGRFDEAARVATEALGKFPEDPSLQAALRTARIQRAVRDAEERLSRGEPRLAIEILNAACDLEGSMEVFRHVLARAEEEVEREARAAAIHAAVSEAETLLTQGREEEALATIERARARFGESHELYEAVEKASAASEGRRRDNALADVEEEVRTHLGSDEFAAALAAVDTAIRTWPGESRLDALRVEVLTATAVRQCESLVAEERFEEAKVAAERARGDYPDAHASMSSRLIAVTRAAEIAACIGQAAERMAAGEPDEAVELLDAGRQRLGSDPRLDAAQRDATIAAAVERAKSECLRCRFTQALAALDSVERNCGADERIGVARDSVLNAQREVRAALETAAGMVEDENPTAAIGVLEATLRSYGEAAEVRSTLDRARKAEAKLRARRDREAALAQAIQECTDLMVAGNLAEAGRTLQNALRDFPGEPDLVAAQNRLKAEWDRRRRAEATRRAADNARALVEQGQPARALELLEAAAAQYPDEAVLRDALAVARKAYGEQRKAEVVDSVCRETRTYLDNNDFDRALETVEINLETLAGERRLVALRKKVIAARREFKRGAAKKPTAAAAQAVTDEVPITAPTREAHVAPTAEYSQPLVMNPEAVQALRSRTLVIAGAGALALTAAVIAIRAVWPSPPRTTLSVETEPAGAVVRAGERSCITPDCRLDLSPGEYRLDARLPGYAAASHPVSIHRSAAAQVRLVLTPLPTSLVVTSNFVSGNVNLDGKPAGELKDGQLTLDKLQPGFHSLTVAGPGGEASLRFKTAVARVPELIGDIGVRDTNAMVVTSLGSAVRAACSKCEGRPLLEGKPLEGQTIASGAHEVTARTPDGETQRAFFKTGEAPAIAVHLSSAVSSAGTLVVETNVDGASVSIDQRKLDRQTEAGRLVIPLEPKTYSIEIHKDGYRTAPARLVAKIRKSEPFRAIFRLEPLPSTVVLSIAVDGATVLVDGTAVGTVRGGSASIAVSPGTHSIALAKEGFHTASLQRAFGPGETVRLDGAALPLDPLTQPPKPAPALPVPRPSTAEEIEAGEWATARSGRDARAVQAFLQKHPDTAHRQEAQQLLAGLEWDALDRNDRAALERFAGRYRGGPLAQQAAAEIARIDHETAAAVARTAAEKAATDRAEISKTLALYGSAFEKKDLNLLKSLWPTLPEATLSQAFGKESVRSQLRPLAPAELSGDRASVRCTRITEQVTQFGRKKPLEDTRTVHLRRESERWVIYSID